MNVINTGSNKENAFMLARLARFSLARCVWTVKLHVRLSFIYFSDHPGAVQQAVNHIVDTLSHYEVVFGKHASKEMPISVSSSIISVLVSTNSRQKYLAL